jgi:hypothetical protein
MTSTSLSRLSILIRLLPLCAVLTGAQKSLTAQIQPRTWTPIRVAAKAFIGTGYGLEWDATRCRA